MNETKLRSIVKAYSWRLCGSAITFCITFIVTGKVSISTTVSCTELVIKPLFYWLHERCWIMLNWGRYVKNKEMC